MGTRQTTVHVGYPKTGSTFLQTKLFAEHSQLEDFGNENFVSVKDYDDEITGVTTDICMKESLNFDLESCKNRVSKTLQHVPEDKNVIISREGLCLPGRTDRQLVIKRIHDLFGDCKIIVVIRRREELITSTCFQHLRYNGLFAEFDDINEWLDNPLKFAKHITAGEYDHPIRRLRYYPFLEALKEEMGEENILIVPYEELDSNQTQFVGKIAEFCGVDTTEAVKLAGNQDSVNKRPKEERLYLKRLIREYPIVKTFAQISPTEVNEKIKGILSSKADFDTELNDYWGQKISELAKKDNKKILENFDIPLEEYNYMLS